MLKWLSPQIKYSQWRAAHCNEKFSPLNDFSIGVTHLSLCKHFRLRIYKAAQGGLSAGLTLKPENEDKKFMGLMRLIAYVLPF